MIVHEEYHATLLKNDLAILVLESPLEMDLEKVKLRSVSVPKRSYVGQNALASGFGMISDEKCGPHGGMSQYLRSTELVVTKKMNVTWSSGFIHTNRIFVPETSPTTSASTLVTLVGH